MPRKAPIGDELEAARIIADAAFKLTTLARGPVPPRWRRLAAKAFATEFRNALLVFHSDPLAHLYKRKSAKKQADRKPRGRPAVWTLEDHRAFVLAVSKARTRLEKETGRRRITDKEAVAAVVERIVAGGNGITREQKRQEEALLRKTLPISKKKVREFEQTRG